ncbi:MAG: 50S ribosomal protein L11 methyltransferase [Candidatus Methylacidiphilales bacterium]|nr:50S ribosomal protein L11 methyltransferase [Candidatus Methylacidiphilales bacterium]
MPKSTQTSKAKAKSTSKAPALADTAPATPLSATPEPSPLPPAPTETILWRRDIAMDAEDSWLEQLAWMEDPGRIVITGLVGRKTLRLEVYYPTKAEQEQLVANHGGKILSLPNEAWQRPVLSEAWRAGKGLAIAPDAAAKTKWDAANPTFPALVIPAAMAFGSGEHGTTRMILREMTLLKFGGIRRVVDIGSGSGILALAARQLSEAASPKKPASIKGFDLDPHATRTAQENEVANFPVSNIMWKTADLFAIRKPAPCDLVLANLYSEILVAAHEKIAAVLAPGGHLLLSGILLSKRDSVRAAFDPLPGLRLVTQKRDGKWAMLHYQRDQPDGESH